MTLEAAVEAACGSVPRAATPLLGGCIAEVYRLDFDDRPPLVAKVARPGGSGGGLANEGFMLDYLARHTKLAVPTTRHIADRLLLMDYVDPHPGRRSEEHTSELQSLMRISYAVFCLKKKTK